MLKVITFGDLNTEMGNTKGSILALFGLKSPKKPLNESLKYKNSV